MFKLAIKSRKRWPDQQELATAGVDPGPDRRLNPRSA